MSKARRSVRTTSLVTASVAVAALAGGALGAVTAVGAPIPTSSPAGDAPNGSRHVLLLSVDGMHQADLSWFVRHHPRSALAALVRRGTEFTHARTPFPSDSFPGLVGQLTGGHPRTTGVYYDVTYNRSLIDPSASTTARPSAAVCASAARGANVSFDESIDRDSSRLDAGQGLAALPSDILRMTGQPRSLINPAALPIDPVSCRRVYPHSYLRVNTVFEVAKRHHLRTAWADKHPAYEILDGPSGHGVDDLFTPEINSVADESGDDWTQVNSLTRRYDRFKVRAVLHEIHGFDHSGRRRVGVPGVFGMNFQSISTAQKLPTSNGLRGGYSADGTRPGPLLRGALGSVNHDVGLMTRALRRTHQLRDTTIILSSKHGQSPVAGDKLKRIDDGAVIDALDAAWASQQPDQPQPLVAASLNDDGMLLWFTPGDQTRLADDFATAFLRRYDGDGTGGDLHAKATDIQGGPVAYTSSGLRSLRAGDAAAALLGARRSDPRVPDVIGTTQYGVVYTSKTAKIAEHGGDHADDRHVPLVVAGPGVRHAVRAAPVETTQVAPTILAQLGIRARALQAVRIEHTRSLPLR